MNKKPYKAPVVKKVHLEIKNAVLSICHSSLVADPLGDVGCRSTGCFNPLLYRFQHSRI